MIQHPDFPFPTTDDHGSFGEKTEEAAWMVLQQLQDEWLERCQEGMGTGGLRDAAEALRDAQRVLERESAHRKYVTTWVCRPR